MVRLCFSNLAAALITFSVLGAVTADAGKKIRSDATLVVPTSIDSLQLQVEDRSPAAGEQINWECMSSGGGQSSDGSFLISGTIGQVAVGSSFDGSFYTRHGYWQSFADQWECGDANASGDIDIDDIIYLIGFVFLGGPPPDPMEMGNTNCVDEIDVDDVVFLVGYVFLGGPAPCDPDGDGTPDCP